jgi:hypothetical protein
VLGNEARGGGGECVSAWDCMVLFRNLEIEVFVEWRTKCKVNSICAIRVH